MQAEIPIRFEADLWSNASIRHPNLNCFVKPDKKIRVKVGLTFVQFECDIKRDGVNNYINHLKKIYNRGTTYTMVGCLLCDTDAFVKMMRPASEYEKRCLDKTLKIHMESYIQRKDDFNTHINGLDLCQRDILPFSYGHNFEIGTKNKRIQFDDTAPTLEMTLNKIRENTSTTILSGRKSNGVAQVFTTDKIRIFYEQSGKRFNRSLFNLIEGTMMHIDAMFYRIKGIWYFMSEDHIPSIHIGFRQFLRDHLITEEPTLKHRWEFGAPEGDYNNLYMNDGKFVVGDDCTLGGVELFDLLKYDSQTHQTYLIYVKKSLNGEIRKLAFQVMLAADLLDKCFARNEDALRNLQTCYASIVKRYSDNGSTLSQHFDTFENFRNVLSRKNKLSIVCAVYIPGQTKNRIVNAIDYFGTDAIQQAFNNLSDFQKSVIANYFHLSIQQSYTICDKILLVVKEYVKRYCESINYGYTTSKLILAHHPQYMNKQTRRFDEGDTNYFQICEPYDERLHGFTWQLIRGFSTFFDSTSAKYSLMHMQMNGFSFKICEIDQL